MPRLSGGYALLALSASSLSPVMILSGGTPISRQSWTAIMATASCRALIRSRSRLIRSNDAVGVFGRSVLVTINASSTTTRANCALGMFVQRGHTMDLPDNSRIGSAIARYGLVSEQIGRASLATTKASHRSNCFRDIIRPVLGKAGAQDE
jgi:hypothetical protein